MSSGSWLRRQLLASHKREIWRCLWSVRFFTSLQQVLVFRVIFLYFFFFHFRSLVFLFNGSFFKRTVLLTVLSFSRIRLNYLMFRVNLSYSKKGNKTCATCFATFLQIELNSDIRRFTTYVRTCVAANYR